jgi:hypothetical protein
MLFNLHGQLVLVPDRGHRFRRQNSASRWIEPEQVLQATLLTNTVYGEPAGILSCCTA